MKLNPVRQKVWKVVHVTDSGRLMSSVFEFLDSKFALEYRKGKLVKPKIGKIFAFDSLEAATKFRIQQGSSNHDIWEAEAYGCEPIVYRAQTNGDFDMVITDFWRRVSRKVWSPLDDRSPRLHEWFVCPQGTVGCRALKLIKKL